MTFSLFSPLDSNLSMKCVHLVETAAMTCRLERWSVISADLPQRWPCVPVDWVFHSASPNGDWLESAGIVLVGQPGCLIFWSVCSFPRRNQRFGKVKFSYLTSVQPRFNCLLLRFSYNQHKIWLSADILNMVSVKWQKTSFVPMYSTTLVLTWQIVKLTKCFLNSLSLD